MQRTHIWAFVTLVLCPKKKDAQRRQKQRERSFSINTSNVACSMAAENNYASLLASISKTWACEIMHRSLSYSCALAAEMKCTKVFQYMHTRSAKSPGNLLHLHNRCCPCPFVVCRQLMSEIPEASRQSGDFILDLREFSWGFCQSFWYYTAWGVKNYAMNRLPDSGLSLAT